MILRQREEFGMLFLLLAHRDVKLHRCCCLLLPGLLVFSRQWQQRRCLSEALHGFLTRASIKPLNKIDHIPVCTTAEAMEALCRDVDREAGRLVLMEGAVPCQPSTSLRGAPQRDAALTNHLFDAQTR